MENPIIDQLLHLTGTELEESSEFSFFYHLVQLHCKKSGLVCHHLPMPGQIQCMEMQSFPPVVSHLPALPCAPMQRHLPCKTTSSPPLHPLEHFLTSSLYFWPNRESLTTASSILTFPWKKVPVLTLINGVSAESQGRLPQMVVTQVTSLSLSCRDRGASLDASNRNRLLSFTEHTTKSNVYK